MAEIDKKKIIKERAVGKIAKFIVAHFYESNWTQIATISGVIDILNQPKHERVRRAQKFGDNDYVLAVANFLIESFDIDEDIGHSIIGEAIHEDELNSGEFEELKKIMTELNTAILHHEEEDNKLPSDPPMAFISYAHEDERDARKLYSDLKKAGANPWMDKECLLPGQKWEIAIKQAIKTSDFFLAVLSSNSVEKRGYVQKEISQALDILDEFPESRIFLIPVRLNECKPSHEKLKDIHWADMFPIWDNGLERILSVLNGSSSGKTIDQEQIPLRAPKKSNPASSSIGIPLNDSRRDEAEIPIGPSAYKTKRHKARITQKNNPPSTDPPLEIKLCEIKNSVHKLSCSEIQIEEYKKSKNKY